MCTAITLKTKDHYFGRTLDHTCSYGEEVTVTPRAFPLTFRHTAALEHHLAIIGVAHVAEGYPLYYDAFNERGLAMAGLNFVGNAHYEKPVEGKLNIAVFELLPWILGQCATVAEAVAQLRQLRLVDTPFSRELPPSQLHWLLADRTEAVTVEPLAEGLRIHSNPAGVLTNNPPFDQQMLRLCDYMALSPRAPENRFSAHLELRPYSFGMGAMGLPGDLSSPSRFVRAAFARQNSVCGTEEGESVSQFFHLLGAVCQPRGCTEVEEGVFEITTYASCCNTDKGIYYYQTYDNPRITGVDLHREQLDGDRLARYPLLRETDILRQN